MAVPSVFFIFQILLLQCCIQQLLSFQSRINLFTNTLTHASPPASSSPTRHTSNNNNNNNNNHPETKPTTTSNPTPHSSTPPLNHQKPKYITCPSTNDLVSTLTQIIQPHHHVVELGAQLRDVSTTLCTILQPHQGGKAYLLDVTRNMPQNVNSQQQKRTRAMRRPGEEVDFFKNVSKFVELESVDQWRRFVQKKETSWDVLVLDGNAMFGNDLPWTSLSIVREFTNMFPECKYVVVKSASLHGWAVRLVHGQAWIDSNATLEREKKKKSGRRRKDVSFCTVVATVGVQEYRKTIACTVQPGDAVLEVGCHLGTSTALLHDVAAAAAAAESMEDLGGVSSPSTNLGQCGYAMGVDIGPRIIERAKQRYPGVFFHVGDAWKTAELLKIQQLKIQQEYLSSHAFSSPTFTAKSTAALGAQSRRTMRWGFDVVYLDVGGLSGPDGVLEALTLCSALMHALEPRCMVIKSLGLRRLSSMLIPYWQVKV